MGAGAGAAAFAARTALARSVAACLLPRGFLPPVNVALSFSQLLVGGAFAAVGFLAGARFFLAIVRCDRPRFVASSATPMRPRRSCDGWATLRSPSSSADPANLRWTRAFPTLRRPREREENAACGFACLVQARLLLFLDPRTGPYLETS